MIKKLIIPLEKLKKVYPFGYVMGFANNFKLSDTTSLGIGNDLPHPSHFNKDQTYYSLLKCNQNQHGIPDALASSPLVGFYELKDIRSRSNYRYVILPASETDFIEVPSTFDVVKPVLDRFMAGRYYCTDTGIGDGTQNLYLYYPQFTIKNSLNEEHTIYDMVVQFILSETGIVPACYGKRFSFTKQELNFGYSHSHLKTGVAKSSSFGDFCLGGSSAFKVYLNTLTNTCTSDQFELLLVQLEQFLLWESIEGRPHISISKLFTNSAISNIPDRIGSERRLEFAKRFLPKLTPDMLIGIGDNTYILDPGLTTKISNLFFAVEKQVTSELFSEGKISLSDLYDFDTETETYQVGAQSYNAEHLPSAVTDYQYADLRTALGIKPKIHEIKQLEPRSTVIKRLAKGDIQGIVTYINNFLTHGQKLNGTSRVNEQSTDLDNRETAEPSNGTASAVSH